MISKEQITEFSPSGMTEFQLCQFTIRIYNPDYTRADSEAFRNQQPVQNYLHLKNISELTEDSNRDLIDINSLIVTRYK